jgi:aryl-alcohol dehydrogenase-like predicted oxidoreductase
VRKNDKTRRAFLAAGLALPALRLSAAEPPAPSAPKSGGASAKRTLGRTGIEVSALGMGCMLTSDPSVIARALDLGVTFFDTARGYQNGNNERLVGTALGARRKNVFVCTKTPASTKAQALADLDLSLKELGTDYVDLWHLHGKSKAQDISDDLIEAQRIAKQQGKTRFAGVSVHSGHGEVFDAVLARKDHLDAILTSYNFSMDPLLDELIPKARAAGVAVIAMKVMAGGFRKAKPGDRLRDTLERAGAMAAALKWVLKNPNVDTAIPSMTDMDQLEENFRAADAPFGQTDAKLLAAQLDHIRPLYCRACGECDGRCALGLPVADILRHLSYAEGYGDFRLARESYRALPAARVAPRCDECRACTIVCPHRVRVAERVARAQAWFA